MPRSRNDCRFSLVRRFATTGTSSVMRGGYFDFEQGFCRASLRYGVNAPEFDNGCGFRVARNP